jgi:hypothetical protein
MRLAVADRPCWMATAAGSWGAGTTERSAPAAGGPKMAVHEPSTKATKGICQKLSSPSKIVTTRPLIAAARHVSETMISSLRLTRSAAIPAGRLMSTLGTIRADVTTPARAGDRVSARTRSG